METSSNKYINLTYLKELSNGSNEFIYQMITVFMEQTPDAVNSMEKYLNSKDWQALHAIAHKTKASFAFMGIKELKDVTCLVEEYSLNKTNLDQLPEMISKIKNVFLIALKELEIEKKQFL